MTNPTPDVSEDSWAPPPDPHTSPSTPDPPSDPPPSLASSRPSRAWHPPQRLEPDDFGAHGRCKESIANAYEDRLNNLPIATLADLDETEIDFILDSAHLANYVLMVDTTLPDSPTLHEALAGPECDLWHAAILEELAAIKDAGTWTFVDPSPNI